MQVADLPRPFQSKKSTGWESAAGAQPSVTLRERSGPAVSGSTWGWDRWRGGIWQAKLGGGRDSLRSTPTRLLWPPVAERG